jgi:hypothetical protein
MRRLMAKRITFLEEKSILDYGFNILLPHKVGNLAMPRIFEVAGAIIRIRTLKIK